MIERFEVGKKYRWIGPKERPLEWNTIGKMDFLLDGRPHECVHERYNGTAADFLGNERRDKGDCFDDVWYLSGNMENFEEVTE